MNQGVTQQYIQHLLSQYRDFGLLLNGRTATNKNDFDKLIPTGKDFGTITLLENAGNKLYQVYSRFFSPQDHPWLERVGIYCVREKLFVVGPPKVWCPDGIYKMDSRAVRIDCASCDGTLEERVAKKLRAPRHLSAKLPSDPMQVFFGKAS